MDKEMVDRVAAAIRDRSFDDDQLADCGLPMADAVTMAIAAIKAMREPPKGFETIVYHGDYADDVWRAMIDHITGDK
jgi:hypothetical protein